jgi:hypothetical protein
MERPSQPNRAVPQRLQPRRRNPDHGEIRRNTKRGYTAQDRCNLVNRIVCIPPSMIVPTAGSRHYSEALRSVCLDFHIGECANEELCESLHVNPDYLQRTRLPQHVVCCAAHGDAFTEEYIQDLQRNTYRLRLRNGTLVDVLPWSIALTESLPLSETPQECIIDIDSVCRMHLEGHCKYSKECRRIHICRRQFALMSKQAPIPAPHMVLPQQPPPQQYMVFPQQPTNQPVYVVLSQPQPYQPQAPQPMTYVNQVLFTPHMIAPQTTSASLTPTTTFMPQHYQPVVSYSPPHASFATHQTSLPIVPPPQPYLPPPL